MKYIQVTGEREGYPWPHVIGYIASILITVLVLWLAVKVHFSRKDTVTILLALAASQLLIQLIFFMRLTEKHGSGHHAFTIVFGFLFTFTVIAGSVWFTKVNYF